MTGGSGTQRHVVARRMTKASLAIGSRLDWAGSSAKARLELDREERSGRTWPNQSRPGPEQEPTWAQVGPNLRRTGASWLQCGTFGDSFTPHWTQGRHNMGNIESNEASSTAKDLGNTSENVLFEIRPAMSRKHFLKTTFPQACAVQYYCS